ncbi:carboxypeptidase-like regulatory domain-containing protein [Engelhardtia mirabilis]|uniref:Carboxypeptidase regulatory-like domain-containing protein n=1 Tax=Engelhardtia mirabilis TaxID=2528011 RepID=A0A518BMQ5_9BACT|nr:hypothetical protein Pla133_33560 [Planctomycetes bacterium Pla133]QDV02587.1 hypothetical protein Pla86_33550 [Planctomycetes bacterium Pla86]
MSAHVPTPGRLGRAALVLLLTAALALVAGLVIFGGRDGTTGEGPTAGNPTTGGRADGPSSGGTIVAPQRPATTGRETEGQAATALPPDGRPVGILRGQVETPQGVTFPERWTLVLEPSRFATGSRHAVGRRIEIEGRATFELNELPLAGYDVFPEAEGFRADRAPVVLSPGRENVYLVLHMERAAFVDGRVLDMDGSVVEGLQVTLEVPTTALRRTVDTDHAGFFRFDAVPDGDYRLLVGPPDAPVLDARTIEVRPPSVAIPTIQVPVLETVRILTVDAIGGPLAGVRVRGSGNNGGYVDVVTDSRGEALVPLLPAGTFRLRAAEEGLGRAFVAADVPDDGEVHDIVLELRP